MGDLKQFLAAGAFLQDGFFACLVLFLAHIGNHLQLLGCQLIDNIRLFEEVDQFAPGFRLNLDIKVERSVRSLYLGKALASHWSGFTWMPLTQISK